MYFRRQVYILFSHFFHFLNTLLMCRTFAHKSRTYEKLNRRHKWTFLEAHIVVATLAEMTTTSDTMTVAPSSSCFCSCKTAEDVVDSKVEKSPLIAELSCFWFCFQTAVLVANRPPNTWKKVEHQPFFFFYVQSSHFFYKFVYFLHKLL